MLYCPWYPVSRYYPTVRVYILFTGDFHGFPICPRYQHTTPWPSDGGEYHVAEAIFWFRQCHLVNSKLPKEWPGQDGNIGKENHGASVYGAPSCIPDKSEIIIIQTEKYYHIISYPNKLTESEKEAAKHSQANLHPLKAKGQARAHCLATQRRDLIAMTHDISWPSATQRPLKRPLLRTKSVEKWPGSWENRGDQGDEAKTWCVLWMRVRGFKVLIDVNRCK